jgi:dTDP-4-dehydrorhamnose reductase
LLVPQTEVIALNRQTADLGDLDRFASIIKSYAPSVIINAAAYTAVDRAETEPDLALSLAN